MLLRDNVCSARVFVLRYSTGVYLLLRLAPLLSPTLLAQIEVGIGEGFITQPPLHPDV